MPNKAPDGFVTERRFDRQDSAAPIDTPLFGYPWNVGCMLWQQEYSASSGWCPVLGLCVTSTTIKAHEEAYGVNRFPGDTVTTAAATSNIIFDLDVEQQQVHDVQQGIIYVPSSFRWAKLKAGSSLRNVDFGLSLRMKDGSLQPWLLDAPGTISVKFMFSKHPY